MSILAIDAGTTGVTALVVSRDGDVVSRGYREFPQHYPQPGWVEHDPEDIWHAVLGACGDAIADREPPVAIGLTNQRETAVVWDPDTYAAPRRAIVWQDRRTTGICDALRPNEDRVRELTGLRLDPYFTGTKLTWLAEHEPAALDGTVVGTVDSYVLARLTGRHATDPSNASRTLLYDIHAGAWSAELCDLFGVPIECLPEVLPSSGEFGVGRLFGYELPVLGIAGDQQAALFGQACFSPGESKCTYGTGSFVLVNTGREPMRSPDMLTTVAWDIGDGLVYALEAIAYEVRDVVDTMGVPVAELTVDGGASANDLLCELQAAQLGVPVRRPRNRETTALGAAFLAGLAAGVWSSTEELRATWQLDRRFEPEPGVRDGGGHREWRKAVERSKGWAVGSPA